MREQVARGCASLIELGWLAAVVAIPAYFNVNDLRIFEPDKAIVLRDVAALLLVPALLLATLRAWTALRSSHTSGVQDQQRTDEGILGWRPAFWALCRHRPPLVPLVTLTVVTLLASASSLLPRVSWQGSYARGQGAETTLAYLVLALLVLWLVRRPAQADRLVAAIALSGVAPASYGWLQHFGRDPLAWQQPDLAARVPGTMGNPIFLGALLTMTIPLALTQLVLALRTLQAIPPSQRLGQLPSVCGWAAITTLELAALLFTKSRGPFAGLLVAIPVFGLALAAAWHLRTLRRGILAVGGLLAGILLLFNLLGSSALGPIRETSALRLLQWTPTTSGTSEVRIEIWGPALSLVARRPLLGCGPEVLLWCYYPVYPTALRHIEAPNAVPDRTHNMLLDAAVETGLLGLVALLALLVVTAATLLRLVLRAADPTRRALAAGLLAALAGHLAEGFFGIAIVSTLLITWLIAALAGALAALEANVAAAPATVLPGLLSSRQRPGSVKRAVGPLLSAPRRPPAAVVVSLGLLGTLLAGLLAWQVVGAGSTALAADSLARQAADLETVALGNSGQAALPPGRAVQPVLALRQFAAASQLQAQALVLAPEQEDYLLSAGKTLVEWAQAAGTVGGSAAQQAPTLYVQALLDFGRAATLNPYNPDHLRNTGKAYERWAGLGHDAATPLSWDQSLLARAAQAFARAGQLAPHHPDPLTSEAEVALWQGQTQHALALANQALALDRRDGDGYRLRAQAELRLGERQPALVDWRRALVDPSEGHPGETASALALAEATWAHARCAAVGDARTALGEPDTPNPTQMQEIVHVDGPACPGS